MKDVLRDFQRAAFLLFIGFKFGIGPITRRMLKLPVRGDSYPVRIRRAMEELGLTYVKLGQFLAMRYDILPAAVCLELNRLFEDSSSVSFADVKAVVESELGAPLARFFPVFDPEPVGAASVAQVHQAWTQQDTHVAVKVQRPGIEPIFASDMRNMRRVARVIDSFGLTGSLAAAEMLDQFASWTQREMDFVIEGHTADRLRKNALPCEVVPRIYWELTTSRVLTMEFVDGLSLSQTANLIDNGQIDLVYATLPNLQLQQALHNLGSAVMHQLFITGFFHGDPHPGNIIIREDNTAAFVDFGIFGVLTNYERVMLRGLVENIAGGNVNESFRHFSRQLVPTDATDLRVFEREAKAILASWHQAAVSPDRSIKERLLARYFGEMLAVVRRNKLHMHMEVLLFYRALIALDSSALRLSKYFDLLTELRQFFEQTRGDFVQQALANALDTERALIVADLARRSPDYSRLLLRDPALGGNKWPVDVEATSDDETAGNRNTKWLVAGILTISSAVLVASLPIGALADIIMLSLVLLICGAVVMLGAGARWS